MTWRDQVARMDGALVDRHFGEPTTYTTGSGQVAQVNGIFDAEYVRVDAGEAGVGSAGPAVFYRLSDLPADPGDDEPEIQINGVTYRVTEVKNDGQGGVTLMLHRL